jgi:glycosyltransferase involved in cell wall biosynthesis
MERQGGPLVTIGLPTYNREWSLGRVLESVTAFEFDKKRLRICFVDNFSTDRTMEIIADFRRSHGSEYESVLVESVRSNIPQARNVVFRLARGTDYVFFLDSDITAPPDTVERLLAHFRLEGPVGIAALPWDNRNARKRAGFLFDAFRVPEGPHEAYKVGNGCDMVSMAAYQKVGGFDEDLPVHEDSEFSFRVRKGGFRIISDPTSEGTHLRDIDVTPSFYLRFMKDSAVTYRELMARGSLLHAAKALSSYALIAAFASLLLLPGLWTLGAFLLILCFCAWLNSSAYALDDGAHVRLPYRPVVGLIFTATTVAISLLLVRVALLGRHERREPPNVPANLGGDPAGGTTPPAKD